MSWVDEFIAVNEDRSEGIAVIKSEDKKPDYNRFATSHDHIGYIAIDARWPHLGDSGDESRPTLIRARDVVAITEEGDCHCMLVLATGDRITAEGLLSDYITMLKNSGATP